MTAHPIMTIRRPRPFVNSFPHPAFMGALVKSKQPEAYADTCRHRTILGSDMHIDARCLLTNIVHDAANGGPLDRIQLGHDVVSWLRDDGTEDARNVTASQAQPVGQTMNGASLTSPHPFRCRIKSIAIHAKLQQSPTRRQRTRPAALSCCTPP